MVKVQARQAGWDRYAGSQFVIEFESSETAKLDTGLHRQRLWRLLTEADRYAVHQLNNLVASTLPEPQSSYLAAFPPNVAEWYMKAFQRVKDVPAPNEDAWFRYYDEGDATRWGEVIAPALEPALDAFLSQPPSVYGQPNGRTHT